MSHGHCQNTKREINDSEENKIYAVTSEQWIYCGLIATCKQCLGGQDYR